METWSTLGIYARIKLLTHLSTKFTCITFDRREWGQSGGRVKRLTWEHYAAQGKGLLDHLKITRAHLMGGCMGCSPVIGVAYPETTLSMILYWPVGGAKYRLSSQRFAEHLAFVQQNGLNAVADLVRKDGKHFGADPRGGPWASVMARQRFCCNLRQPECRSIQAGRDRHGTHPVRSRYSTQRRAGSPLRLDRPALIVPGEDASHATSAARYLQECLPRADYWDAPVTAQTEEAAATRPLTFLDRVCVPA